MMLNVQTWLVLLALVFIALVGVMSLRFH